MSTQLIEAQFEFSRMLGNLLVYVHRSGYTCTLDIVWTDEGHEEGDCHSLRLAACINLFFKGRFLNKTEDHKFLGEYWERQGGTWGGRFEIGNHYSLGYGGRR